MPRYEALLQEFNQQHGKYIQSYRQHTEDFINFLVDKIERLENPIIISEIEVKKGGDTNDNPKEIKSKVEEK